MSNVNKRALSTLSSGSGGLKHHRSVATRPVPGTPADARELLEQVRDTIARAQAPNSVRAYRADVDHYLAWCETSALLPEQELTVAGYITRLAEGQTDAYGPRRVATIRRRLTSIGKYLAMQSREDVTKSARVREVWRALRKLHGHRAERKRPAVDGLVTAMAAALPNGPTLARDRALLLFGQASMRRGGELRELELSQVERVDGAAILTLRKSKTNRTGKVERYRVESQPERGYDCPVVALDAWLAVRGDAPGPLFTRYTRRGRMRVEPLGVNTLANLVKRAARLAGTRDAAAYASHSLRAGGITSEAAKGASFDQIRKKSGQSSYTTIAGYIREAELLFGVGKPEAAK